MAVAMKISQDAFENMPYDSGMLLKTFNVNNPTTPQDSDILCTTSGDISINTSRDLIDLSEDVNNLHGKYKEYQIGKAHTAQIQFTSIEFTDKALQMALGSADISGNKVSARNALYQSDFQDVWWVCKTLGDKLLVIHLMNTLSSGGVQFSTSKEAKGKIGLTLDAFSSVTQQDIAPIEFYIIEADTPSISVEDTALTLHVGDSAYTLRATVVPDDATVTWTSGDTDVCTVASSWNGVKITPVATGRSAVTGSITVDGVTYTATCLVDVVSTGA